MIVDVIPSLKEISPQRIYGKVVIVLDIFRCTSTIVTALANGCKEILPASTPHEASNLASKNPQNSCIIAGEINGEKIFDFDLGNSPLEFSSDKISGKKVVLTTTNGTETIRCCKGAKHVLIGSFLNMASVCACAAGYAKDITIVCAGTRGNIALEDVMAAGCHVLTLKNNYQEIRLSELARTFYYLYQYFRDHLTQLLSTSRSGVNLSNLGFEKDIEYCLQQNKINIVPVFSHNSIKASGYTLRMTK